MREQEAIDSAPIANCSVELEEEFGPVSITKLEVCRKTRLTKFYLIYYIR